MRRKIGPLLPEIEHLPYPDCYRCPFKNCYHDCNLHCLEYFKFVIANYIPAEEIAAIIIEPIQGDAGIIVPPIEFVCGLYKICKENDILFVAEEVQQGFGRTGRWFSIEHFDVEPDMIILGKAIAAGMPLSAVIAKTDIMQALESPAHLLTTSGNPISCAAALANIEVIEEEGLIENANILGSYAKERFNELKSIYNIIGDVRGGIGLSIGVDLVLNKSTRKRAYNETSKNLLPCMGERSITFLFQ